MTFSCPLGLCCLRSMWTGKSNLTCAFRTKTGKLGKAQELRRETPESDLGSEQPLKLVILRLSWEGKIEVNQIRGSEGPSHGGRVVGRLGGRK